MDHQQPSQKYNKTTRRTHETNQTNFRCHIPAHPSTFLLVAAECAALGVFTAGLDSTDTHEIKLGDGGSMTRLELLEQA